MNKAADFETVREIKEKLCYIRLVVLLFLIIIPTLLLYMYSWQLYDVQLWLQTRIPAWTWDHNPCEKLHCKYIGLLLFLPCSFSYSKLSSCYQLPDGRVIKVGTERFQAPEALFTPVRLSHLFLHSIADCGM